MISLSARRVAINTCTYDAIELRYTGITEVMVRNYLKDNPSPAMKILVDCYDIEDFISDLHSSGIYSIPLDTPQVVVDYIEDLLNDLV